MVGTGVLGMLLLTFILGAQSCHLVMGKSICRLLPYLSGVIDYICLPFERISLSKAIGGECLAFFSLL